jgi:hypothetical protein
MKIRVLQAFLQVVINFLKIFLTRLNYSFFNKCFYIKCIYINITFNVIGYVY